MRGSWVLQWPITTILSVHWGREDYVFLCRGGWIKERNQASQKCGRQSREWQQEKSREMAKKALNQFAESHGLHLQHYHCDNCCFADDAFKPDCEENKQCNTYCGVNSISRMAFLNEQLGT